MTAALVHAPEPAEILGLSPEQKQAAILLATGLGISKVAEQLGVDRRTLWRWRQQPVFALAFEYELAVQARLMREAAQAELLSMTEQACAVVRAALELPGPTALAAARIVLARAEAPMLRPLPTAEDLERQIEADRQQAERERVARLPAEELNAELAQLRAEGRTASPELQRARLDRMSPQELNAAAREAYRRRLQQPTR